MEDIDNNMENFLFIWNLTNLSQNARYINLQNLAISAILATLTRRQYVPKIEFFAERTIPQYSLDDFKTHFRISRDTFFEVLDFVKNDIKPEVGRGKEPIQPDKKILIFLCYMANMESHREIGHYFGICKASVFNVLKTVSQAIIRNLSNLIRWPDLQEQDEISREFQLKCGLPGIVGVIDGSHVRLASCPRGDTDYINRKGFPSMQLQAVVDQNMLFRNVYTGWPGCTHDGRVLRNSTLSEKAESENFFGVDKYLIGDSAYPVKTYLIPPFKDNGHLSQRQKRFNYVLSSSRQVVERTFGLLKGRFRRLKEITVHKPRDIVSVIVCGCILHNLTILNHEDIEEFIDNIDDGDHHPNRLPNIFRNNANGIAFRDNLVRTVAP